MPSTDDSGHMIITLVDLYADQQEIRHTVTTGFQGVTTQLSAISQAMTTVTETQSTYRDRLQDHESRLRQLERFRNAFPAVLLTSVLSLIAVIADVIVRIINHG